MFVEKYSKKEGKKYHTVQQFFMDSANETLFIFYFFSITLIVLVFISFVFYFSTILPGVVNKARTFIRLTYTSITLKNPT